MSRYHSCTPSIVLFALLSGCATEEGLRSQISQIEQRVTGLGQRVEQLSAGNAGSERAAAAVTEKLSQTQHDQTTLGAKLETLTQDTRGLRVQIDATEKRVEQLQTQQKDSGDRLSRVELSAAQAALIGQQAATTAQLTASSAQTALQSIAEQAHAALAALSTKHVIVSRDSPATPVKSNDVGPDANSRSPRPETIAGAKAGTPPPGPRQPQPQSMQSTTVKSGNHSHGGRAAPPSPTTNAAIGSQDALPEPNQPTPQAQTHSAGPGKTLRTILPRATPVNPPDPEEAPPSVNAETAYQLGLEAFSQQRYSEAIRRLEELRRLHPDSPLAVLSLYRLGEAHYAQHTYPLATQAFQAFLDKQPSGAHVPSILLKLGLIAQTMDNIPEAQQRFTTLTKDYPNSHEATVARDILNTISQNTR